MTNDADNRLRFAIKLLEVTVRENRAAMNALGHGIVGLAETLRTHLAESDAEQGGTIMDDLEEIIQAMQCHDITDQRLMHVLSVMQDENFVADELFTQEFEHHLWDATLEANDFSPISSETPQAGSGVELF